MHNAIATGPAKMQVGVRLQRLPAGKVSLAPQTRHLLAIHVGAPVRASCRLAGQLQQRLQMPGDIDIVPAGFAGEWEDEAPCSVLTVSLTPALMAATAARMQLDPAQHQIRPQLQLRDKRIEHIAWALKAEADAGHSSGALYLESLGTALAVHLLGPGTPTGSAAGVSSRQLPARQWQQVIAYIEAHLDADLSLAQLAAVAGLSVSHFKLLFKQSAGISAHQYVMRRRVEYAKELILRGRDQMSQIALQSGFAHQSHMARCMRQVLGVRPGDIARRIAIG
ncbi:AraC family transcriptional regulator [Undibacterium sp.]|jgi:AraC family transcriptional regulator|uniref:AraC family transcriptional regulator n=1 Tax=Undibacterium sp. TaxID=1914977 RepID=UPI002BF29E6F|nr:AraC family transcriptional regulator [Undibacterium sp.]HTD04426.1 AraC family transcriptional regulator [Undibacterium sp.]